MLIKWILPSIVPGLILIAGMAGYALKIERRLTRIETCIEMLREELRHCLPKSGNHTN